MKKRLIWMVFITLLLSATVALAGPGGKGFRGEKAWGMKDAIFSELNLTEEQEGKVKALRDSQRQDITPLRTEMLRKRAELQLLWLEDKPDGEKIKAKQKEMREIRGQIQDKMTDFRLAVHSILTPEQRSQLMASRFNKMRHFRRGMRGPEYRGMERPPGW